MNNKQLFELFEKWAKDHLGQGHPLTMEDHTYEHPVTRWAFKAWCAAHNAQQSKIDSLMLEFCPDEMTAEQVDTWGDSQRRSDHIDEDDIYENL